MHKSLLSLHVILANEWQFLSFQYQKPRIHEKVTLSCFLWTQWWGTEVNSRYFRTDSQNEGRHVKLVFNSLQQASWTIILHATHFKRLPAIKEKLIILCQNSSSEKDCLYLRHCTRCSRFFQNMKIRFTKSGNLIIFLPLRFYVKSFFGNFEVSKTAILTVQMA